MTGSEPSMAGGLVAVHNGRRVHLLPSEVLTFGRAESSHVRLDPDDRGISRHAGSVEHELGTWWVCNRSAVRAFTVVDDLGIRSVVAPGRRLAVVGALTIVVDGSIRRHALEVWTDAAPDAELPSADDGELPTSTADDVVINDQDRLVLVALFAGYLESFPRYDPHPRSYADAAARLGWPRTTLVKRMEYLRARLSNAGVPNLTGEAAMANLAEWTLTTRILTRDDLALLSDHPR